MRLVCTRGRSILVGAVSVLMKVSAVFLLELGLALFCCATMAAASSSNDPQPLQSLPCPKAFLGVDWLFTQAARIEGAKPAEERSQHFVPIMGTIGDRTRRLADETGAEDWQRELRKLRMENLSSMIHCPQRLLTYVAGRPMAVLRMRY